MTIYNIYTDGSCSPNPGRGGWAYVVVGQGYQSGAVYNTTNNRMELRAVIQALKDYKDFFKTSDKIEIFTDSILITKWNSVGKGKKNRDMVDELIQLNNHYKSLNVSVIYTWIKGHSGIQWNEFVDDLAGSARIHGIAEQDSVPIEQVRRKKKQKSKAKKKQASRPNSSLRWNDIPKDYGKYK